jgi:hypothetical protein
MRRLRAGVPTTCSPCRASGSQCLPWNRSSRGGTACKDWDLIPGARGCTPESCAFRDHHAELARAGAEVIELSTQAGGYLDGPVGFRVYGGLGPVRSSPSVPASEQVVAWVSRLPGPVAITYGAEPTGFGLARAFEQAGIRCLVVAPSKLDESPSPIRCSNLTRQARHGPIAPDPGADSRGISRGINQRLTVWLQATSGGRAEAIVAARGHGGRCRGSS